MGAKIPEPPGIKAPDETMYLFDYHQRCRGVEKITHLELESFARLMGLNLSPFEANVIINIDCILEASRA